MSKFLLITYGFELIAAILATIHLKKYFSSTEKYFFHFLWFTVFIETIGVICLHIYNIRVTWMYNLFIIISFTFYFYWYISIIKNRTNKKILTMLTFIFLIFSITNLFIQNINYYISSTFVLGASITILGAFFFFYELLNSDQVLNIKHDLRFWISAGLLFFNVGMIPFILFSKYFINNNMLTIIVLISLNFILYSCYSLGFICMKKK